MIPYQALYELLEQYVFGSVSVGSYQELVCILVATIGALFVVAIPFIVVYKVLGYVVGR